MAPTAPHSPTRPTTSPPTSKTTSSPSKPAQACRDYNNKKSCLKQDGRCDWESNKCVVSPLTPPPVPTNKPTIPPPTKPTSKTSTPTTSAPTMSCKSHKDATVCNSFKGVCLWKNQKCRPAK
jgi:hypothetical protein